MNELLERDGALFIPALVSQNVLAEINSVMRPRASAIFQALGDRSIGIGSRYGYREIVQRSPGRFDIRFEEIDLLSIWGCQGSVSDDVPWINLVREILGEECLPSFCGGVFSQPGASTQQWHIDSPHESHSLLFPHAINVFIALEKINLESGPTEVVLGSHYLTNHFRKPALAKDHLLYQSDFEITPEILSERELSQSIHAHQMEAGDCLVFDDRILHRGLKNSSGQKRWMAYFSYMRPRPSMDKIEDTHFLSKLSLF